MDSLLVHVISLQMTPAPSIYSPRCVPPPPPYYTINVIRHDWFYARSLRCLVGVAFAHLLRLPVARTRPPHGAHAADPDDRI